MFNSVHFLFGSQMGAAEMVCEDLENEIGNHVDCKTTDLKDILPGELDRETLYVIVSSTTGSGDVPTNAEGFYKNLLTEKPDLSSVHFAVFGLGDTTFGDTFNQGSEKLMEAMKSCGAQLVAERGIFDASSGEMPEEIAIPWLRQVMSDQKLLVPMQG